MIIDALEVKHDYTLALEELAGPVKTTDELLAIRDSSRMLL